MVDTYICEMPVGARRSVSFLYLAIAFAFAAPLRAQIVRETPQECSVEARQQGVMYGVIRDGGSRELLPGAVVSLYERGGRDPVVQLIGDERGAYLICAPPTGLDLLVQAHLAGHSGVPIELRLEEGELRRRDLEIYFGSPGAVRTDEGTLGRIIGTIVDHDTQQPIDAATLELVATEWQTLSDDRGVFVLEKVEPGQHVLRIHHIAYGDVMWPIAVPGVTTMDVRVELSAEAIALDPIVVTTVRSRQLEQQDFYERMEWSDRTGIGVFITAEEIEQIVPMRTTSLLAQLPQISLSCGQRARGCMVVTPGVRNTIPGFAGCAHPTVLVDGAKMIRSGRPQDTIDALVIPSEIAAIEVYTTASEIPAEFSGPDARCGVIVIWTKRGG